MNTRVLYIGNQRVDLPASVNFNLVWQCAEPGELKIYGSGSSTIKLPFTPANDAVFRYSKFLTVVGGREFETFQQCRYYERGMLMIDNGTAFLTGISDGYEICLTWGNGDYVQKLKDTSVADLEGETFAWNDTVRYPYVETSKQPNDYATFYKQGTAARFRHALTRPLYMYRNILESVGIGSRNLATKVWAATNAMRLQANSLQAKGRYVVTVELNQLVRKSINTFINASNYTQIGKISVAVNDDYKITLSNLQQVLQHTYGDYLYQGDLHACFFISQLNQQNQFIGRRGGFNLAFRTTSGSYQSMLISDSYQAFYNNSVSPTTNIDAVASCVVKGDFNGSATFTNQNGEDAITLKKDTDYYIYVMLNEGGRELGLQDDTEESIGGATFTLTLSGYTNATSINNNADTKIETPENPVLTAYPPKVVQMLGYSTAHDIVSDFMRLFPLMLIMRGDTPYYFDFSTVLENKAAAYDFSPYFVRLDKVEFGNTKVGLRNEVKMAEYEDFTGKRAIGIFTTVGGKGNGGDYAQLSQITSYDTLTSFNGEDLPYFPSAEISYDDKTSTYTAKLQDRPNLLLSVRGTVPISVTGDDNKEYDIQKVNRQEDTLQYIIDTYWQEFINIVGTQKTVTVTLNINPGELKDFDFRRPVYMKQLSVYVFAQKITYKGDGVAELQGIVLPSTAQGIPKPVEADGMLVDSTDTYVVDSTDTYIVEQ